MESLIPDLQSLLIQWGYTGLFIAAAMSGSIIPFSSEIILAALISLGLDPYLCLLWGTLGNTLGGMSCYYMGYCGKMKWIERYMHVSHSKLENMQTRIQKRGAYMAFFAFLPAIGEVIAISLGLMRANLLITTFSMFLGKLIRYILLIIPLLYAVNGLWNLCLHLFQ